MEAGANYKLRTRYGKTVLKTVEEKKDDATIQLLNNVRCIKGLRQFLCRVYVLAMKTV